MNINPIYDDLELVEITDNPTWYIKYKNYRSWIGWIYKRYSKFARFIKEKRVEKELHFLINPVEKNIQINYTPRCEVIAMTYFRLCALCSCSLDPDEGRICDECEAKNIRQQELSQSLTSDENGQMQMDNNI